MRFSAFLITLLLIALNVNAYSVPDSILIRSDNSTEQISRDLDSLVNTWYVKLALRDTSVIPSSDTVRFQYPDSVYISRLSRINSIISLPYNTIIRNHIHVYTIRQREKFRAVLGLKD